eukprot:6189258-Pleurochrysis_carterae.AAC.3
MSSLHLPRARQRLRAALLRLRAPSLRTRARSRRRCRVRRCIRVGERARPTLMLKEWEQARRLAVQARAAATLERRRKRSAASHRPGRRRRRRRRRCLRNHSLLLNRPPSARYAGLSRRPSRHARRLNYGCHRIQNQNSHSFVHRSPVVEHTGQGIGYAQALRAHQSARWRVHHYCTS